MNVKRKLIIMLKMTLYQCSKNAALTYRTFFKLPGQLGSSNIRISPALCCRLYSEKSVRLGAFIGSQPSSENGEESHYRLGLFQLSYRCYSFSMICYLNPVDPFHCSFYQFLENLPHVSNVYKLSVQ